MNASIKRECRFIRFYTTDAPVFELVNVLHYGTVALLVNNKVFTFYFKSTNL